MMKPQCVHSLASEAINISLVQSLLVPLCRSISKQETISSPTTLVYISKRCFAAQLLTRFLNTRI